MYALIIVIGVSGQNVVGVGVTSQIVGHFKTLDDCKAAAAQPYAAGPVSGLSIQPSWGAVWYCTYTGAN
jgi:hypothetical protein